MIKRFRKLKKIVQDLTGESSEIDGITQKQKRNLELWQLSNNEWSTLEILEKILFPFFYATKLLSGKNYPTLSLNLYVYRNLSTFLTEGPSVSQKTKETLLKEKLLTSLEFHFENKISASQKEYTLVKFILIIKADIYMNFLMILNMKKFL